WQDRSNKKRCFSQLMLAKLLCQTLKKIGSENWKEKEIKEGISKWLIQASTRVSRGKKTCAEVSSDEDDNVTSWNTRIRRERLTFIEFLSSSQITITNNTNHVQQQYPAWVNLNVIEVSIDVRGMAMAEY
ncbi:hypothetical protein PV326_002118, partial [Microctonus aethiopoides]